MRAYWEVYYRWLEALEEYDDLHFWDEYHERYCWEQEFFSHLNWLMGV